MAIAVLLALVACDETDLGAGKSARMERRRAETSADLQGAQRVILGREHEPEGQTLRRPGDAVPEPVRGVASENRISSTIVAHHRADVDEIDRELPTVTLADVRALALRIRARRLEEIERWSASQGLP